MAKTIKFNLVLDDHPVRTLEDLQENFSIEDILGYFKDGLLERWLKVRGYQEQCDKVSALNKADDEKTIIKELIKIFDVEARESDIEQGISILSYLEEQRKLYARYRDNNFAVKQIIDEYHSGYEALVKHMEENKDNMKVLKDDAIKMERDYKALFDLDYEKLYYRLAESSPKAVFAMLTRDVFRDKWIYESNGKETVISNHIQKKFFSEHNEKAKEILGEDLKIDHRDTQQFFDLIEGPEVKCMVISIAGGAFVTGADKFEKLDYNQINGHFVILNGLQYACNFESDELLYMEV